MKIRLEKVLASYFSWSRKDARKNIKTINVLVNNILIKDGSFLVDPSFDVIEYNNQVITYQQFIYLALNKPKGYICANRDNLHQTVFDLIDKYQNMKLHIIGRLDKDTTGLVLITNDGEWSHKLRSPKSKTDKEYEVILKLPLTDQMVEDICGPLSLDDQILKPIKFIKTSSNTCNMILTEGKYHQIKRMFHLVNNEVQDLKRIRIGEIKLQDLKINEGEWKELKID